jgi:tRNA dimethylallyltransferase
VTHVVVIMGPTASGKSALALKWAQQRGGEIVSIDSMQVYRGLEIGTAQPTPEERKLVPHHLVGFMDIRERVEVFSFCERADAAIADIAARGRVPILAGGTGLYLRSLLYGLDDLPNDPELRAELDREYDSDAGEAALRERMRELDPAALEKLSKCRRRLIRALEVRLITGRSLLELQGNRKPKLRYEAEAWRLDPPAEVLKDKIARRAHLMLESGWIDEAKRALDAGLLAAPTAHQALGYRIIAAHLRGEFDRAELERRIVTATWQFARRQRTWFRHQHAEARVLENA